MKNLYRIRKERGLTQAQLAAAAGCNQGTISKIEKDQEKNVSLKLAGRIAKALRVEPVELFGVSELEQRFLEAMRKAPQDRQNAVLLLLGEGDE